MSGYTLFALAGLGVLGLWAAYTINVERVQSAVEDALGEFCDWADATLDVFADEDEASFRDRLRAVAAADAAEVQA